MKLTTKLSRLIYRFVWDNCFDIKARGFTRKDSMKLTKKIKSLIIKEVIAILNNNTASWDYIHRSDAISSINKLEDEE
jgi:hypothetical protein